LRLLSTLILVCHFYDSFLTTAVSTKRMDPVVIAMRFFSRFARHSIHYD